MNTSDIALRLADIAASAGDDEGAHCMQDELYEDFIAHVATLESDLGICARLVLTVRDIEFERWYA
jgi:hypothetical protein